VRAAQDFARRHARTLTTDPYSPGTLVLVYQAKFDVNNKFAGKKYRDRWAGPFRVRKYSSSGAYKLEELDGTPMKGSVSANRVKVFFRQTGEPKLFQTQDLSDSDSDPEELEIDPLIDKIHTYIPSKSTAYLCNPNLLSSYKRPPPDWQSVWDCWQERKRALGDGNNQDKND
jgi:hypothetical protein